jgi:hypothetical protein
MTAKEKAEELVNKFKDYVHGYVGSSMLTNHEYPEQILSQAKKCALIAVDELIKEHDFKNPISWNTTRIKYWNQVKKYIQTL